MNETARTGPLRVAINYGNPALAARDPASGRLSGVSVDIAEKLARRLGLTPTFVPFDTAGKVTASASRNVWDVAFLARDPLRAREISFTAPYVVIQGRYVVRNGSPVRHANEVDRPGVRMAVVRDSAYDLFLRRSIEHAELVYAANTPEAIALFASAQLDVLAGVEQALRQAVAGDSTLLMLPEPFMKIEQAMGVPAGRAPALAYLHAFIEQLKHDGEIAAILAANGQAQAQIAPPEPSE